MKINQVYLCDPDKNTKCRKTFCHEFCKATAFEEYAKRDENGAPIIATESDRVPQIKINREVFEKCEEETETITVSKGCLKARKGRFVVYDVEYLKTHIDIETKIYGQHAPECDDCISRQKAISAIQDEYYADAVGIDIVDIIAHMPPVIPKAKQQIDVRAIYDIAFTDGVKAYKNAIELEKEEKEETEDRPTGRWIDIQYFKNDDTYYRPKCPFCSIEPKEYSNFCPNCGARMAESEGKK